MKQKVLCLVVNRIQCEGQDVQAFRACIPLSRRTTILKLFAANVLIHGSENLSQLYPRFIQFVSNNTHSDMAR